MYSVERILIWGTGKISATVERNLRDVNLVGYVETVPSKDIHNGKAVYSPANLPEEYDAVVLAVSAVHHENIHYQCKLNDIDEEKICAVKRSKFVRNIKRNIQLCRTVFQDEMYAAVCSEFGIDGKDWIKRDAEQFEVLNTRKTMKIREEYNFPIYRDRIEAAGSISSYFWQDLWAARKIFKANPEDHYDIGSRVDGFIAHLLSFRSNVHLIDIRSLSREVDGLFFLQSDATNLENIPDNSIESLSALCSLEHFGMGRYGDPIDPEACYKCFKAIVRKMKPGGNIYIGVPVGKEHIEFNAHRVFYASTIVDEFAGCELVEYSCTKDGYIEYDVELKKYDEDAAMGGMRFGLFHLIKKVAEEKQDEESC